MEATNIVDVVGEFVTLRKSGVNYKGLCPFHDDKTPSFMVSPARQICKCFSCGEGGNAINFLMKHEQITYPEALRWLAKKYSIEIQERELTDEDVIAAIPTLRESVGDRAILRALHFFGENRRVAQQKAALQAGDIAGFFDGVLASGRSSFCYLQNVYTTKNLSEQGLSLALCLADGYLNGKSAAWRVHGGGFAGTIQAFVPSAEVEGFRARMDAAFGEGNCIVLRIRQEGATRVL
jgi:galactokinase